MPDAKMVLIQSSGAARLAHTAKKVSSLLLYLLSMQPTEYGVFFILAPPTSSHSAHGLHTVMMSHIFKSLFLAFLA